MTQAGEPAALGFGAAGSVVGDPRPQELVVPVSERVVERKVPLKGTIRKVDINGDQAALVEIDK